MSVEKITKEELLEKLGRIPLSDDELTLVAGGGHDCYDNCDMSYSLGDNLIHCYDACDRKS